MSTVAESLAQKRRQLEQQLDHISAPPEDAGGISFGKRVGEGTSMAVDRLSLVAAHERLQTVLAEVVRAEQKLEDGTYGRCDVCGEQIAADRLEVWPWAAHCVRDAPSRS